MELLELQAGQWKISPEVEGYYCDMLADIMAKESQPDFKVMEIVCNANMYSGINFLNLQGK